MGSITPLEVARTHTTGREMSNATPRSLSFKYQDPMATPIPASVAPCTNKEMFLTTVLGTDLPALSWFLPFWKVYLLKVTNDPFVFQCNFTSASLQRPLNSLNDRVSDPFNNIPLS